MPLLDQLVDNSWIIVVAGVALGLLVTARRRTHADPSEDVDPDLSEARERRDDAFARHDYPEARRWATEVVQGHPEEDWLDLIELGTATALDGDHEQGWRMIDDAVEQCGRADARLLPAMLVHRAIGLLMSGAPSERVIAAAEEARRANPRDENLTVPLLWAYAYQGRFDEAEELGRLRSWDDEEGMVASMLAMVATFRRVAQQTGTTLDDLHRHGFFTPLWDELRAQQLGFGLSDALAALDETMPAALRDVLRPPAGEQAVAASGGERKVLAWHDGQDPGAGAAWGLDGDFRLMSCAEIQTMDAAIDASPEKFPQWDVENVHGVATQVMTDDRGGHLIAVGGGRVVLRREGVDDVAIAPTLADFFWDRVAAWGGRDPRPPGR